MGNGKATWFNLNTKTRTIPFSSLDGSRETFSTQEKKKRGDVKLENLHAKIRVIDVKAHVRDITDLVV